MKRPFGVTLIALAVLTITAIHLIRLVEAMRQWNFLESLPGVSAPYLALTGLAWTLVGLPLTWGIWRGLRWAPTAARITLPAYFLYAFIERIFVANPAVTMDNTSSLPFMLGATLISLVLVFWVFSRPVVKSFFRRTS